MARFEVVSEYADKNINIPIRKTKYSAGYDFEVAEDIVIPPYKWNMSFLQKILSETARHQSSDMFKDYLEILNNFSDNDHTMTLQNISDLTKKSKIKPSLVPTGIKVKLDPDQYLELSVRSSCPLKSWLILANGVGIIDADYYNNEDNEGHIYFQIINFSPFPIQLKKGDTIGQGIIKRYETVEGDETTGKRKGGFGSSDE